GRGPRWAGGPLEPYDPAEVESLQPEIPLVGVDVIEHVERAITTLGAEVVGEVNRAIQIEAAVLGLVAVADALREGEEAELAGDRDVGRHVAPPDEPDGRNRRARVD